MTKFEEIRSALLELESQSTHNKEQILSNMSGVELLLLARKKLFTEIVGSGLYSEPEQKIIIEALNRVKNIADGFKARQSAWKNQSITK